jgi:mannose-6-phosphate isomerase
MSKIYKFEPHYFERVWGGRSLEALLNRQIPEKIMVGESWDLVDREDCQSICTSEGDGKLSLRQLLSTDHENIMGPGWNEERRFPVLVKWLDCTTRLSLQVHPPRSIAEKFSGEPKTENWYVAHATSDAGLFLGLKKGTTKDTFLNALKMGTLESLCHRFQSRTGDSILVESGRIHAIDGGNLILEIQQNSDTTFRVYDWDRKNNDGSVRKLHIEESLQCIDFHDFEPSVITTDSSPCQVLADCEHFRIRKFQGNEDQVFKLKQTNQQSLILNPIDTEITVGNNSIMPGELGLSPYQNECLVHFKKKGALIVTDNYFVP